MFIFRKTVLWNCGLKCTVQNIASRAERECTQSVRFIKPVLKVICYGYNVFNVISSNYRPPGGYAQKAV